MMQAIQRLFSRSYDGEARQRQQVTQSLERTADKLSSQLRAEGAENVRVTDALVRFVDDIAQLGVHR